MQQEARKNLEMGGEERREGKEKKDGPHREREMGEFRDGRRREKEKKGEALLLPIHAHARGERTKICASRDENFIPSQERDGFGRERVRERSWETERKKRAKEKEILEGEREEESGG